MLLKSNIWHPAIQFTEMVSPSGETEAASAVVERE
jgi:hypothetical protein